MSFDGFVFWILVVPVQEDFWLSDTFPSFNSTYEADSFPLDTFYEFNGLFTGGIP